MQHVIQEHEFTAAQEKVISTLVQAMTVVAIAWFIGGGLMCLTVLVGGFLNIIPGMVFIALGQNLWNARRSMRAIIDTEGADIMHLMMAMDGIRGYFKIMGILVIIAVVLVVIFAGLLGGKLF